MLNRKGQGTIEYLVIIAIVVVIALVVVGLLLQVMGNSGGASETSVKAAWKSAQPWAITDWTVNGTTLTLVLRNNSAETLGYNAMYLSSGTGGNDKNTGYAANVAPGATRSINIPVTSVAAGAKYSFPKANIRIDYNTVNLNNVTQYAAADIVGTAQ